MPALMPRDVLFDTALLRYCFDAVLAVGVTGNWQQFVPFGHAVVFLDDVSGNVQQPDIRFDACFLAVRVDPQMPVERGAQVGFRQVRHIRPAQTRKGRKKHLSKGDRNEENQTQPVVNKRFCSCLPLQPNSRERQDNARFPLPSHYLFRYLPEA